MVSNAGALHMQFAGFFIWSRKDTHEKVVLLKLGEVLGGVGADAGRISTSSPVAAPPLDRMMHPS